MEVTGRIVHIEDEAEGKVLFEIDEANFGLAEKASLRGRKIGDEIQIKVYHTVDSA